ncbi:MAG TPA: sortase [Chloroflexia bacterium]|jgi:sortase A
MARRIFTNKFVATCIVSLLALLGLLSVAGFSLLGSTEVGEDLARQTEATPTAIVIARVVRTLVPPATATPTSTATSTATATPTFTPSPTQDPDILPNGVRYGDHNPNLPGRVVRITSPNIKLDTEVYEVYVTKDDLWEVADYAAGHHYTSANPGEGSNVVISGHNNWRGEVFRYLENLKIGDVIQLWTQDGKEYKYKVEEIKKLKEAGVSYAQRIKNAQVIEPTDHEQLTLVTCWPYTTFTHRLIVIAKPLQ